MTNRKLSIIHFLIGLIVLIILIILNSCSTLFPRYQKTYTIDHLIIQFADHQTINQKYKKITGINKEVLGFYDPRFNEIWCEWDDYETCWHEIKHALGFHHSEGGFWYANEP